MSTLKVLRGMMAAVSLAAIGCVISTGDDLDECQDACNDASATCVNNCADDACRAACEAARVSCIDDCD
jgi:hypothetical protein